MILLVIGLRVTSLGCISFVEFFYYKSSLHLCSKPRFLVANDQSSRNACSKYPSETNWIWQFFRETILLPLLGGGAPAAIASAPASIVKFKRPECTRLHLRELQSQKFSRRPCARNSLEKCAVRSPDGRYRAHITTVYSYYISRSPLSQNPPSATDWR